MIEELVLIYNIEIFLTISKTILVRSCSMVRNIRLFETERRERDFLSGYSRKTAIYFC